MRHHRATLALLSSIPTLLGSAACTPDFDQAWQVNDLRLLAIRAEPPEVLLPAEALSATATTFPPVRVDALGVDPREPDDAQVDWRAIACTPETQGCQFAALSRRVFPLEGEWASSRLDQVGFDFELDQELALAALAADPFRGFGGLPIVVEIHLRGREEVVGLKRLVYGLIDPPDKRPNSNPRLGPLQADDEPVGEPWVVGREQQVVLLPASSPGSAEPYVVRTFDLGTEELEEYLSYSFFVTGGELSHGRTGGKPLAFVSNKKLEDLTSEWTTPAEPQPGRLWVVVRDDRGGVAWGSWSFEVE